MPDTYDLHLEIWNEYVSLEKELLGASSHLPLVNDHLAVWSLKLGDLLIVLGSVIDSFFKVALKDECLNEVPRINAIRNKRQIDMRDYKLIFERYYNISSKNVYLKPLKKRIRPFQKWGTNKTPEWWEAYQSVKHNRFENREDATLGVLLDGLAALFLLTVVHIPSRILQLRLNLWHGYMDDSHGKAHLENNVFNRREPIGEWDLMFLETDLYGYILEGKNPESREDATWHKVLAVVKEPKW